MASLRNLILGAGGSFYALARTIIIVAVLLLVIHLFVGTVTQVNGSSMEPTLADGQLIWINKLSFLRSQPQRGQVVVLTFPGDPEGKQYVKRVIGLPGETLALVNEQLRINGELIREGYVSGRLKSLGAASSIQLAGDSVPEYYLLGDNRTNSTDSRNFGPVEPRFFVGSATAILWPLDQAGFIPIASY